MSEERDFSLTLTLREGYQFDVDFEQPGVAQLLTDEPPPLGEAAGPNPARLLAAAVGNCMSASLLFCLRKSRVEIGELRTRVTGTIVRNEQGRLRVGQIRVELEPNLERATEEQQARISRCLELFEDFCIVGESVRQGIDVQVQVK